MKWFAAGTLCLLMAGCGGNGGGDAEGAAPPGETVYIRNCYSCHAAGLAGAPRVGRPEDWAPRLAARGREGLVQATIEGVPPGMPPRGLCARCSDEELAEAVDYMLSRSLENQDPPGE